MRLGVLLAADLAAFWTTWTVLTSLTASGFGWLGAGVREVGSGGAQAGWYLCAAFLLSLLLTGNYGKASRRHDPGRLLAACALAAGLSLWSAVQVQGLGAVLPRFASTVLPFWAVILAERVGIDMLIRRARGSGRSPAKVLFVGESEACRSGSASAAFADRQVCQVVGFVDMHDPPAVGAMGHRRQFGTILAASKAAVVVICGHLADAHLRSVLDAARLAGCRVLASPRAWTIGGVEPLLVWNNGEPFVELHAPVIRLPRLVVKRVLDLALASVGLLLLSPLLGFLAVCVKLDTPGPVLYASPRWGRGGRHIRIWKFRTMVDGAARLLDSDPGLRASFDQNVKLKRDPRVTQVGRWLRRWSLDELPQLWNIVVGDLSLVGPRAKLIGEEFYYGAAFDTVLSVPPGLTGLWQISGRNSTSYEQRVALDVHYALHASLWWDLWIMLRTLPVVVTGHGAY